MQFPAPQNYTQKMMFALAGAVTSASTDEESRTVTYRRAEAAQACLAMAAIMLNSSVEGAPKPTPSEVDSLIARALHGTSAWLDAKLPAHPLDAERDGFKTVNLA